MLSPQKWEENYLKRLQTRRGLQEVPIPLASDLTDDAVLLQHTQPLPDPVLEDSENTSLPTTTGELKKRSTSHSNLLSAAVAASAQEPPLVAPREQLDEDSTESVSDTDPNLDQGIAGCCALWKRDRKAFWARVKTRWPYYTLPIVLWIRHYNWKRDFPADVVAGIGVAAMLIPQCLAYAILAGLPPVQGLYTALFPALIYACMTTSR